MNELLKIAWRNIWRNRRRTLITCASILFAVLLSTLLNSIQKGAWDKMVDNVVNFYFGYGQVHSKGFWDDQSIDKAFILDETLQKIDTKAKDIPQLVPRIESFALASYQQHTAGVLVVGTSPEAENEMTQLTERVVEGRYFKADQAEIMVAAGILDKLNMQLGDTLVLISQGYHGVNAAGKYPIVGVVKFGSPELNKQLVYLPLATAQQFYGAENLATTLALDISSKDRVPRALQAVKKELPAADYEVMNWQELMPELVEAQQMDTAGNNLIMLILYVIIAFGIFGTILMMTKEREYEFGVLTAIGMSRWRLSFAVWLEIAFMGLIGAATGILAALPLVYYFHTNPLDFSKMSDDMAATYEKFGFEPIFPAAFELEIFLTHALIVLAVTTVLAIYPTWKIMRLKPVEAMRQ